MKQLEGKIALITEGGSTGLAIARLFASAGGHVYITGKSLHDIKSSDGLFARQITLLKGDVSSFADRHRLLEKLRSETGRLDIAVIGTGISQRHGSASTPECYPMIFDRFVRHMIFSVEMALQLLCDGGVIFLIDPVASDQNFTPTATHDVYKTSVGFFAGVLTAFLKELKIKVHILSSVTPLLSPQFWTTYLFIDQPHERNKIDKFGAQNQDLHLKY